MRSARAALGVFAALMLCGCAAQMAPVRPAPAPARATAPPAQTPARPSPRIATARVAVDSLPTPEALAVLASLPEPTGVSDAPARASAPAATPAPAPVTPPPAESAPAVASTDTAAAVPVPVPVPTPVLGEASAPATPPAPASAPATSPPPAPATPPTPTAAPSSARAAADTCWRVQIAAPLERDKGDAMREMAQSQLVTPMVIDVEAGRYKVRSRDCLPRAAASALRERALASGFKGVFLVAKVTAR
jgi:outer membrane biosynthesis protein TonB